MIFTNTLNQARPAFTSRSDTFIIACKAKELSVRLGLIIRFHGNNTMEQVINGEN